MNITKSTKLKVIFFGNTVFALPILKGLRLNGYNVIGIIAHLEKQSDYTEEISLPVKGFARRYKIPFLQPTDLKQWEKKIKRLKPDLIVSYDGGYTLPVDILRIPKFGCLKVHPSLLPRWRGASAVQRTILNGDGESGVTIIMMDNKMDHGPIVIQKKVDIANQRITCQELSERLNILGAKTLIDILPAWLENEIEPEPQDERKAKYAKTLGQKDGRLDWLEPAESIERKVRALDAWPGCFCWWRKNKKLVMIRIMMTRVFPGAGHPTYPIGKTLVVPQNELCVQTGEGFLVIERLQLEGEKPRFSEDFLRDHLDFIGTILE